MLPLGKVMEIQKYLAEGRWSQRKIARLLGVSRATVNSIASGKRPSYEARLLARPDAPECQGPIERCQSCGGRVYMPCRLCRVRQAQAVELATLTALRKRARRQAVEHLLATVRSQDLIAVNGSSAPAGQLP